MRKVKWGVLGVAKIATEKVIPAMQRAEFCDIAAIASRDAARARDAAKGLGIARAYGSYEALLADPEIEAIYNPLPNELHVPWTVKALEAGKHVLCEKPVALDAGEAETLIAARDKAGRLVAEAFMVRHHPQWRRARELARSGAIGEVRAIQTFFSYRLLDPENVRNRPPGGGGLYDIGCYAVVTARYIFGAEPARVVATLDRDPNFGTDRLASAHPRVPRRETSDLQRGDAIVGASAGDDRRRGRPDRDRHPLQRAARPADADRRRFRAPTSSAAGRGSRSSRSADQYGLQGDAFARAVRGEAPLEFGIEDAVHEHAGDRSAVPLGRARELGDAVAPRPACVAVAARRL